MSITITKENFSKQIDLWQQKYDIYYPKISDECKWQKLEKNDHLDLKTFLPMLSPSKKFLFSSKENVFEFVGSKLIFTDKPKLTIILGISAIDLKAIEILDKIFCKDEIYKKNRSKLILIGFGPDFPQINYDVFIKNSEEILVIHTHNAKIKSLFSSKFFQPSRELIVNKPNIIDPLFADKKKLANALKKSINDSIWERLAKICLGCGICSYVCPLCYCFSSNDKIDLDSKLCPKSCQLCSGRRERLWDSCMLSDFSKVAGSFNFRPKLRDRIYNWYHHKFVRFPQEYGTVGCVSCGRCIKYCPAKINYRKVLEEVLVRYQ